MAHEYSVGGAAQTLGAVTAVFINPIAAPNVNLEILRCWLAQSANATSAQQRVQLETQVTAFPTVASATPAKLKRADAISIIVGGTGGAGTSGITATAEGGTKTAIFDDAFNVLNGWLWVPTPRETIMMPAGSASGFGMFIPIAPATTTNWHFGVNFAEV
jgi:hypothetical protein